MDVFFKMFNSCFRLGKLPAWHNLPHMPLILYVNCLVLSCGAGMGSSGAGSERPPLLNSPDSFRPSDGEGRELKHKCHLTILSFFFLSLDYVICSWHSTREQKQFCFCSDWLSVKVWVLWPVQHFCQPSAPPLFLHACSESEGGGREEVLTFCLKGGVILIVFTYQV